MSELSIRKIKKQYLEGDSIMIIAKQHGTSSRQIKKLLEKAGVQIRTKSEAQILALKTGRLQHPTKGKKRPESLKLKIGKSVHERNKTISEEERAKRKKAAKERWDNRSLAEVDKFRSNSAKAIRKAAMFGSKTEHAVFLALQIAGYDVEFHKREFIPNEDMEVDMLIPSLGVAIEIDGPTHFQDIWGEENLTKRMESDMAKNGLLMQKGFKVIRVKTLAKIASQIYQQKVGAAVVDVVNRIKDGSVITNLVEIEVSNDE